jgi:hypothetical protein
MRLSESEASRLTPDEFRTWNILALLQSNLPDLPQVPSVLLDKIYAIDQEPVWAKQGLAGASDIRSFRDSLRDQKHHLGFYVAYTFSDEAIAEATAGLSKENIFLLTFAQINEHVG